MRATASGRRAATVFYIINVLLFPITLVGYVIWLTRIYMARRASSITAQGPLSARSRVTFVDAAVGRYLATINQFVILGAGFDTRAFRLPRPGQIRCFEVDMPRTSRPRTGSVG
jgi:O-methyltransferase involved in polyketide biosynthesis